MTAAALQRENQRLALQHHTLARHLHNTWCTVSAGCVQNSSTGTAVAALAHAAHGAPKAACTGCVQNSTRTNMRLRQACMQVVQHSRISCFVPHDFCGSDGMQHGHHAARSHQHCGCCCNRHGHARLTVISGSRAHALNTSIGELSRYELV